MLRDGEQSLLQPCLKGFVRVVERVEVCVIREAAQRHCQLVVDGITEGAIAERRLATGVITQPLPRR